MQDCKTGLAKVTTFIVGVDMIAKGQYGINFIDKVPVIREDPVDFKSSCAEFLKLRTLSETFEKSLN